MALSTLGLLTIGSIPTVIGIAEAIDAKKKQNEQAKGRIRFKLTATFASADDLPEYQAIVVFRDNKLYLSHPSHPVLGYWFNGYYFAYPGPEGHQGLVSPVSDDPPALGWIYADKETGLLRHGTRKETEGHVVGPWGWSKDEQWLTLEETSNFVAVQNGDTSWTVHYDRHGNLEDVLQDALQVVDVDLHRELELGVSSSYTRDP